MAGCAIQKFVILTRPLRECVRLEPFILAAGFQALFCPVQEPQATGVGKPAGEFSAVMLTSQNAVKFLQMHIQKLDNEQKLENESVKADLSALFALPCFCVGERTAEAAHNIGFKEIYTGSGNSVCLAELLQNTFRQKSFDTFLSAQRILHICGTIVREDGRYSLQNAGFSVVGWPIYTQKESEILPPAVIQHISNKDVAAAMFFSSNSAALFKKLCLKANVADALGQVRALALSEAVAGVLSQLTWLQIDVATHPNEKALLSLLSV